MQSLMSHIDLIGFVSLHLRANLNPFILCCVNCLAFYNQESVDPKTPPPAMRFKFGELLVSTEKGPLQWVYYYSTCSNLLKQGGLC